MKKQNTRRALLMSVLSLLLCASMLIGTTFAWFTDSVTSGRNQIVAGNLDVELEYWDGDSFETVGNTTKLFDDAALWEPGYTEVAYLKVSNVGSLALKYQLNVNVFKEIEGKTKDGDAIKLSDHLVFKAIDLDEAEVGTYTRETAKAAAGTEKGLKEYNGLTTPLAAKGKTLNTVDDADYLALVIYMPETVGNEANHNGTDVPSIEMGVTLFATQFTAEEDSFDELYDKNAWNNAMIAGDAAEFAAAVENGGKVKLGANITLPEGEKIVVAEGKTVEINLNGKTLEGGFQSGSTEKHVYPIENRGKLVLSNGTVIGRGVANYGDLTVESGTYNAIDENGGAPVWNYAGGKLTVNGGTFQTADDAVSPGPAVLNNAAGAETVINGGTFIGAADQTYAILNYGKMTINDIDVSADHGVVFNSGTLVLNGGIYKQNGTLVQTSSLLYNTAGTMTVNGGTYKFNVGGKLDSGLPVYVAGGSASITGGTFTGCITEMISNWGGSGTASVTGGTFEKEPAYIAAGFKAAPVSGGFMIVPENGVLVTDSASLQAAIENAPATGDNEIVLAPGTYADDIKLTVAALGGSKGNSLSFKAVGGEVVLAGTVTLGYREQTVGATMFNTDVTFEGITFDHAAAASHSLDIQDVKSLKLIGCKLIGDGEYGLTCARGNGTGTSLISGCEFENAAMQLLGNFATGLVIQGSSFKNSRINVQAGNGVTVQNCTFDSVLTDANVGDSFYLIRTNSTPVTVKECKINIDSTVTGVAASQAKWGMFWNRGTTNWTMDTVQVTLTDSAKAQTELLVTKCTSTGAINGTVTVL